MSVVRFVFCPEGAEIFADGQTVTIPENHLAVTQDTAQIHGVGCRYFDFHTAELQHLYHELHGLIDEKTHHQLFKRLPVCHVCIDAEVTRVSLLLAEVNPNALLCFIYVYCLLQDKEYFSNLLVQLTAGGSEFLSFIKENLLQPWSVTQFAKEFDMPVRKFNLMFYEQFGTSAKHWLLLQRLGHAKELLESTSMKVLDVALECGFSNHAHFTGCFRRHFDLSPKECRRGHERAEHSVNVNAH
ncbi:MAG: helix-turn-helix transcriptional regulator [Ottowia sp.]|nr:helix-turn-helix transcriptional regulator [Ottowia sp.]